MVFHAVEALEDVEVVVDQATFWPGERDGIVGCCMNEVLQELAHIFLGCFLHLFETGPFHYYMFLFLSHFRW